MTFSPELQARLLELCKLDQRKMQLTAARKKHPSHAVIEELSGRADDLRRAAVAQQAVIFDLERDAKQVADDIARVVERRSMQEGRIERNEVPLRDVSSMQHEIDSMTKRIGVLETQQLEVEERLEAARGAMGAMKTEADAIIADVEAAKAGFTADMADTDEELRQVIADRDTLAGELPPALLSEYNYAFDRNSVLAVIEVRDGIVVTPGAELSPMELDALRNAPADDLFWTEDTSQIVVRTK